MRFNQLQGKEKAEYITVLSLFPFLLLFQWLGKKIKFLSSKKRQLTASVLCGLVVLAMLPITVFASSNVKSANPDVVNTTGTYISTENGDVPDYKSCLNTSPDGTNQSADSSVCQAKYVNVIFCFVLVVISIGTLTGLLVVKRKKRSSLRITETENRNAQKQESDS